MPITNSLIPLPNDYKLYLCLYYNGAEQLPAENIPLIYGGDYLTPF